MSFLDLLGSPKVNFEFGATVREYDDKFFVIHKITCRRLAFLSLQVLNRTWQITACIYVPPLSQSAAASGLSRNSAVLLDSFRVHADDRAA